MEWCFQRLVPIFRLVFQQLQCPGPRIAACPVGPAGWLWLAAETGGVDRELLSGAGEVSELLAGVEIVLPPFPGAAGVCELVAPVEIVLPAPALLSACEAARALGAGDEAYGPAGLECRWCALVLGRLREYAGRATMRRRAAVIRP